MILSLDFTKFVVTSPRVPAKTPQVYPPQSPDIFLHEYVLAGWGCPIGQLSDVKSLFFTAIKLTWSPCRGTLRSRSVSANLPGAWALDLLRDFSAVEYAWRCFLSSEQFGNLLETPHM